MMTKESMASPLRPSGISLIGDVRWGTHFGSFYETKQDLLDILVPYFKAGLENNEFCLWVIPISERLTVEEAKAVLREVVPGFDRYLAEGRMEIISHGEWFLKGGAFDPKRVAHQFKEKIDEAVAKGFAGMRSSASSAWMAKLGRATMRDFEAEADTVFTNGRSIAECNFPLATIGHDELIDMAQAHQFSLVRRNGKWGEGFTGIPALIRAREETKRLNDELQRAKASAPKPSVISSYGLAVLSVIATLIISRLLDTHMITSAPVSLFLCAIMFSTLHGGLKPGFLATALFLLAFKYYYVPPVHSLAVDIHEIPRLLINILAAFFVVTLGAAQRNATESLKRVRDVLDGTLQGLKRTNESLQSENIERKRAEEEVKKAKNHLRFVLDTTPAMIHTGRPDGYLDYFNQRWLDYVGLPLEEMQGWGWMKAMHPDDVEGVVNRWRASLASGEPFQHEGRLRRADGEYRWMLYSKVPLRDEHGNIVKWHGSGIDIEDRKRAEETLKNTYDQLRALSARLQSVREEEAARIAREIHDELGQNLTGLKMDLLRAERKLAKLEPSPSVNAALESIVSATALADGLVAAVQEIAAELRPGVLDKLGLGSALQYEARHFLERTDIAWEVRLPETEPELSAEVSIALFRIFQECLTNIVRHAHATKIEAALEVENGWVTLRVRDNGRGITETDIANPGSFGLLGMKERTALLGGEIVFRRGTDGGTIVTTRVPNGGKLVQMKASR